MCDESRIDAPVEGSGLDVPKKAIWDTNRQPKERSDSMRTTIGFLLLVLCGSVAAAAEPEGGPPFDRDTILTTVSIIDGVAGAWTAYELASGHSSGLANGLTIVSTGPAAALGAAMLKHDSNDAALWVTTIAAGALFTFATVDIMKRHLAPGVPFKPIDESGGKKGNAFSARLMPRIEPVPNERTARVGLAVAGTF